MEGAVILLLAQRWVFEVIVIRTVFYGCESWALNAEESKNVFEVK